MSLIRMHFARNEISDRSFFCLDYTFFQEKEKSSFNPHQQAGASSTSPWKNGGDVEEEKKCATDTEKAIDYARLG